MQVYLKYVLATFCVVLVGVGVANAEMIIITPASATASTAYIDFDVYGRTADLTIDGSGLTGTAHSNQPYVDQTSECMWLGSDVSNDWIQWDLGATYDLIGFRLWNYNESINGAGASANWMNAGIASADILVSADGTNWTTAISDQAFTKGSGLDTYTGEDYALAVDNVRYMKFSNLSNFGNVDGDGDPGNFVGLSEIRFGVEVPEPGSMALLITGAVGLLIQIRRKRK